jgi:hypothetical protein
MLVIDSIDISVSSKNSNSLFSEKSDNSNGVESPLTEILPSTLS